MNTYIQLYITYNAVARIFNISTLMSLSFLRCASLDIFQFSKYLFKKLK